MDDHNDQIKKRINELESDYEFLLSWHNDQKYEIIKKIMKELSLLKLKLNDDLQGSI